MREHLLVLSRLALCPHEVPPRHVLPLPEPPRVAAGEENPEPLDELPELGGRDAGAEIQCGDQRLTQRLRVEHDRIDPAGHPARAWRGHSWTARCPTPRSAGRRSWRPTRSILTERGSAGPWPTSAPCRCSSGPTSAAWCRPRRAAVAHPGGSSAATWPPHPGNRPAKNQVRTARPAVDPTPRPCRAVTAVVTPCHASRTWTPASTASSATPRSSPRIRSTGTAAPNPGSNSTPP